MMLEIDISCETHSSVFLKEDTGYFRNLCQHQSINTMEKVLEHLRVKAEREYEKLEREFSV
jgi:hypothetical protein